MMAADERSPPNAAPGRLDTTIKDPLPELDLTKLPLAFQVLPPSVKTLLDCVQHQIDALQSLDTLSCNDEDALDDGFMICDLNVVRNKLVAWHSLFPGIRPFFALKCHPDPIVACVLGQLGAGFDCASASEIALALENGPSTSIIYANPQRAETDLHQALRQSVRTLTFDGQEELIKVAHAQAILQKESLHVHRPSMVLRLLVPDEHSTVPLGEKFGAAPDCVKSLTLKALELGLVVEGVSFHCGSGNHDPQSYQTAIQLAVDAVQTINDLYVELGRPDRCWLVDIGGGYPGYDGAGGDLGRFLGTKQIQEMPDTNGDKVETAADVAAAVVPLVDELSTASLQFIAEPGRYFVEAAFVLCSRIYRTRVDDKGSRHYYIAHGVQGLFKDCVLCGESFWPIPYSTSHPLQGSASSTVHGPSGEDYDVICIDYPLPILDIGDWLIFDRMGAYTLSIAARGGRPPVRYVMGAYQLQ